MTLALAANLDIVGGGGNAMPIRFRDLAPSARDALVPYLARRLCLIPIEVPGKPIEVGTGAFISVAHRRLVVTCAHVALPFLAVPDGALVVAPSHLIPLSRLSLIHANSDPEVDVALLEVHDSAVPFESFTLHDMSNLVDFTAESFEGRDFLICGMPGTNVRVRGVEHTAQPLLFTTEPSSAPLATRDHLYAAYPMTFEPDKAAKFSVELPHPGGLSGSLLFVMPSLLSAPKALWSPELMKIAGIVVRMSASRDYLEAVNIERLREAVTPLLSAAA